MSSDRIPSDAKIAFFSGMALIILVTLVNDGTLALVAAPLFVGLLAFAAVRVPTRVALLVLMFLAFVLENPNEHQSAYRTPLSPFGAVFFLHLKNTTGISILFLSALEYSIIFVALVAFVRGVMSGRSEVGFLTPRPIWQLAWLSLATSAFMALRGLVRGGDFSMVLWQLDRAVYVPILTMLFAKGLRGRQDIRALWSVILWAAVIRAGLAIYVREWAPVPIDPSTGERWLESATSHHDSMLFAAAVLILVLPLIERDKGNHVSRALSLMPILVWGMIANDRRMVYVQVAIVPFILYFVTPPNAMKRRIKKLTILFSPLILAYIMVGWNAGDSGVFKPVGIIRSVVEPDTDSSSLWREIENYDLLVTFRSSPLMGQGLGHPFWEIIPLPAVSYPLEYFLPHNSILGIWAFGGWVGFTGLTLLWASCVFFAMRAYYASKVPIERAACSLCMGCVVIYQIQCFGDVGFGAWAGVFLISSSIVLAGKLAVSTGAWTKTKKTSAVPVI